VSGELTKSNVNRLISADDYAQKLRRLDSLQNTEEEEEAAIKLSASPFIAHFPASPIATDTSNKSLSFGNGLVEGENGH
jgi:hypothetical protein